MSLPVREHNYRFKKGPHPIPDADATERLVAFWMRDAGMPYTPDSHTAQQLRPTAESTLIFLQEDGWL